MKTPQESSLTRPLAIPPSISIVESKPQTPPKAAAAPETSRTARTPRGQKWRDRLAAKKRKKLGQQPEQQQPEQEEEDPHLSPNPEPSSLEMQASDEPVFAADGASKAEPEEEHPGSPSRTYQPLTPKGRLWRDRVLHNRQKQHSTTPKTAPTATTEPLESSEDPVSPVPSPQ